MNLPIDHLATHSDVWHGMSHVELEFPTRLGLIRSYQKLGYWRAKMLRVHLSDLFIVSTRIWL